MCPEPLAPWLDAIVSLAPTKQAGISTAISAIAAVHLTGTPQRLAAEHIFTTADKMWGHEKDTMKKV